MDGRFNRQRLYLSRWKLRTPLCHLNQKEQIGEAFKYVKKIRNTFILSFIKWVFKCQLQQFIKSEPSDHPKLYTIEGLITVLIW